MADTAKPYSLICSAHSGCSQASDFLSRLSRATSDKSARFALQARTAVSRRECPHASCSKSVRSKPSANFSFRSPFSAPVSPASSAHLCERNDNSSSHFSLSSEWAVTMVLRPDKPCDRIGPVLGTQGNGTQHLRELPHGEVASAIRTIRASNGRPVVELAFEFVVLTATRSGDVRRAVWTEIDRDERVWTIPAPITNGIREHRVPLRRRALEILYEARGLNRGGPLVFPGRRRAPLGRTDIWQLLTAAKIGAVPHGFRSSLRDWVAEETGHPREVAEAALAHKVRDQVKAAYRRMDLFERRLRLMEDRAAYLLVDGEAEHQ